MFQVFYYKMRLLLRNVYYKIRRYRLLTLGVVSLAPIQFYHFYSFFNSKYLNILILYFHWIYSYYIIITFFMYQELLPNVFMFLYLILINSNMSSPIFGKWACTGVFPRLFLGPWKLDFHIFFTFFISIFFNTIAFIRNQVSMTSFWIILCIFMVLNLNIIFDLESCMTMFCYCITPSNADAR